MLSIADSHADFNTQATGIAVSTAAEPAASEQGSPLEELEKRNKESTIASPATVQDDGSANLGQAVAEHKSMSEEIEELLAAAEVEPPACDSPVEQPTEGDYAWIRKCSDKNELKTEAVNHVAQLAQLGDQNLARIFNELNARGITQEWLSRELKPLIKQARPKKSARHTWRDYVNAANQLGYTFRLNELDDSLEVNGQRMTDAVDAELLSLLHEQELGNAEIARRAFLFDAKRNSYHPIRDYLDGLEWNGKDNIAELANYIADDHRPITYTDGTQRSVFHAVLRRWAIGAVGKVYDHANVQTFMVILDGAQGRGKSFFVRWLCPLPKFALERNIEPGNKDYDALLTTSWIWEVPELGALMRKADRESLKAFLTMQQVTYRPPYGKNAITKPALASFIGTVNFEGELLSDPTGNRRFFPVRLTEINQDYSKKINVNQLWAQAYDLYKRGEAWQLSAEERAVHAAITQQYEVEDVLAGYINDFFEVDPANKQIFTHTTDIIDTLRTSAGIRETDRQLQMRLAQTLHRMGLTRERRMINGVQGNGWSGIRNRHPDSLICRAISLHALQADRPSH